MADKPASAGPYTNTYTLVAKIKPGQADSIRKVAAAAEASGAWGSASDALGILHFERFFMIGEEYLVFTSEFDGETIPYLEDFYSMEITPGITFGNFNAAWQYTEGWPPPGDKQAFVDFWLRNKVEELLTYSYFPGVTAKEVRKAVRVQKAFQSVLDNPAAAEALKHPALKALLDEAAD